MRPWAGWRSAQLMAGALGALLAGVLGAPLTVRAGCSNHPVFQPPLTGEASKPAHQLPVSPALPARPCHGPECSRDSLPPPASAPLFAPGFDPWGLVPLPFIPGNPEQASVLTESSAPRPVRRGADIYHPPRFVFSSR